MKRLTSIVFAVIILGLAFNVFIKSRPEADVTDSYQSYVDDKAIFIDVREESEVKEGIIKGAIWIPLSKINENKEIAVSQIKEMGQGKQIFIYCKSGNRAGKVKTILGKAGVEALNLGGYSTLKSKKLPTQNLN